MPLTTPRLVFASLTAILIAAPSATFAQTGTSGASSTLELTLETGPTPSPSSATKKTTSRFKGRAPLASRGGLPTARRPAAKTVVLGKVAQVSVANATLRVGREGSARVLSTVGQGTYLAIVSEVGEHYGVLMIDKTTGWVPKGAVKMIDYQVAVGNPDDLVRTSPPPSSVATDDSANGALPDGLDARTAALLREAFSYLGVPYVWAGNTRDGLDCSGFVKNVFATQGVRLPRHSGDQARVGAQVEWKDLRPGDRLYFDMGNKGRISHTGIYLGNGYFIHASSNQKKVGMDLVTKESYFRALVCARRS